MKWYEGLKNNIIGIKHNEQYVYYENGKWYECDNSKIKDYKKKQVKKKFNEIYGFVEKGKFKIIDLSKFKNAFTVDYKESKRSVITGRACATFPVKYLYTILEKLKIPIGKLKKNQICDLIELKLRGLDLESDSLAHFDEKYN